MTRGASLNRLALRLAWRELRGGIKGFRTFLACLALGVGAIAAIGSLSSAVIAGLEAESRSILGGDISVRMVHRPISGAQLAWLEAHGTVSRRVAFRTMARRADGGPRRLIELKSVDGRYPLYGRLVLDPPQPLAGLLGFDDGAGGAGGAWGAVAEAAMLERLGIVIGDKIRVGAATYRIRAVIADEPDRASGVRAIALGPHMVVAEDSLAATGLILPGSLVSYYYRVKLPQGVTTAAWKRRLHAAFPDAGWRVRDHTEAAPSVRRFIDRTTLFLTFVGLTALLVGGVGVGNSVRTYLNEKSTVIATLKCLGAPSKLIFRTYLAQIAAMAAGGIALGLVIGGLAPLVLAGALSGWLPAAARLGVYFGPLALAAGFGLLTALAASLAPIARACAVPAGSLFRDLIQPVRSQPGKGGLAATAAAVALLVVLAVVSAPDRRLALWFVAGAAVALAAFMAAGWAVKRCARAAPAVRGTRLRLALANLHRPGAPTASILLSLGLGLTVLVAVAQVEGNLRRQIEDTMPAGAPGFYFIDIQPGQVASFETTVRGIDGVGKVRRVPMLRGRITAVNGIQAAASQVRPDVAWVLRNDRGLTWSAAAPEGTRLVAGEWWPADYAGPPLVSLDANVAEGFGIGLGDTLTFNILGRPITATIASLRDIQWGTLRMHFVVILSPGIIERAPQTHIASVYVAPGAEAALERAVAEQFANVTLIRVREVLKAVSRVMEKIAGAVRLTALITVAAATLVLGGAVAAGHHRRVYDAVVLKVLGARRRDVLAVYLMEFGLVGLAATTIAMVLGGIAAWAVITRVMHLDWIFLPWTVALTALAAAAVAALMGFAGTWTALGRKPASLLRNE